MLSCQTFTKNKNLIGGARDIDGMRQRNETYACHECYGTNTVLAIKTNTD